MPDESTDEKKLRAELERGLNALGIKFKPSPRFIKAMLNLSQTKELQQKKDDKEKNVMRQSAAQETKFADTIIGILRTIGQQAKNLGGLRSFNEGALIKRIGTELKKLKPAKPKPASNVAQQTTPTASNTSQAASPQLQYVSKLAKKLRDLANSKRPPPPAT